MLKPENGHDLSILAMNAALRQMKRDGTITDIAEIRSRLHQLGLEDILCSAIHSTLRITAKQEAPTGEIQDQSITEMEIAAAPKGLNTKTLVASYNRDKTDTAQLDRKPLHMFLSLSELIAREAQAGKNTFVLSLVSKEIFRGE